MGTEDDSTKCPEIAQNHNSSGHGYAGQGVQTNIPSDTQDSPRRDPLPADSLCHDPQQSPSPTQDLYHQYSEHADSTTDECDDEGAIKPHRNRTVDRPRRMEQIPREGKRQKRDVKDRVVVYGRPSDRKSA